MSFTLQQSLTQIIHAATEEGEKKSLLIRRNLQQSQAQRKQASVEASWGFKERNADILKELKSTNP